MPETEACPECGLELPAEPLYPQVDHMTTQHPEVVQKRLEDAGFELVEGDWVDRLCGPLDG